MRELIENMHAGHTAGGVRGRQIRHILEIRFTFQFSTLLKDVYLDTLNDGGIKFKNSNCNRKWNYLVPIEIMLPLKPLLSIEERERHSPMPFLVSLVGMPAIANLTVSHTTVVTLWVT